MRYLSFTLADSIYGLPVERVEVVLEMQPITRVPNAKPQLRGVINHRGSVVPVIDPRISLACGYGAESAIAKSIIVMQLSYEGEDITIGVLADAVREVVDIASEELEPPPSVVGGTNGGFIRNVARQADGFIVLLDVDTAFLPVPAGT